MPKIYLPKPIYEAKPYLIVLLGYMLILLFDSQIPHIFGGIILFQGGIVIGERHEYRKLCRLNKILKEDPNENNQSSV